MVRKSLSNWNEHHPGSHTVQGLNPTSAIDYWVTFNKLLSFSES